MNRFPDTHLSVVEALAGDDAERRQAAADLLVRAYRAPVVDLLRWRWNLDGSDAEDLTQEFFATALLKGWLTRFDPAKARFRTFLRVCAERFATKQLATAGRQKRGGDREVVTLNGDLATTLSREDDPVEARFRQEWARSILTLAVDALREEAERRGRSKGFALFEAYDLVPPDAAVQPPTYAVLARDHALSETQVLNQLAWARRRLRTHVLGVLRRLAGTEEEYREDVRELLGIEAP